MPKITLAEPWTYRTPLVTVSFPAGTHEVTAEIAAAAPQQPEPEPEPEPEEASDGNDRIAAPRAPRRARKAES